jgi:hypothetical protein
MKREKVIEQVAEQNRRAAEVTNERQAQRLARVYSRRGKKDADQR